MKILLCVWGNYKIWKKVRYQFGNAVLDSNTTLPLLYKEIKPDRCFIILGDTLIDAYVKDGWQPNIFDSQWYEKACENIKLDAEKFINEKLQSIGISPTGKRNPSFPEVLVIPAVGNFQNVQCMGHPSNFYSVLLYRLFLLFQQYIQQEESLLSDDIEIYLDITHGINYMTTSTYSIMRDLCGMLAFFCNVKFIVLNSDPVSLEKRPNEEIATNEEVVNINEIEKVQCQPQFSVLCYPENKYVAPSNFLNDEEKRNICINIEIKSFGKEIISCYSFSAAVQTGVLLYIYKFFPDIKTMQIKVDEIFSKFNKFIRIVPNENNKKITIQQQILVLPLIREIIKILLCAISLEVKYGIKSSDEITVKECRELISFYEKQKILKVRIARELDRIGEAIESAKSIYGTDTSMNYIKYVDLVGVKPKKQIEERDFFAHSGFAYDSTYLRWDGENIFIKIDKNHLEDINKMLYNNVPSGI